LANGAVPIETIVAELAGRGVKDAIAQLERAGLVQKRRVARPAGEDAAARGVTIQEPLPELMEEQRAAFAAIVARIDRGEGGAFLLHGVTASGKTEVYLRSIAHARERGLGAIVLVPEIALTPQLEARFRARFGDDVAVLHSALPDAERRKRWQKLRRGEANIALGPRSAVWAPVRKLAIIVVDEEHDPSFKQGSDVRYNGRDLALARAHHVKGVAVLGSATPSLESLHLVETKRLTELRLKQRVAGRPMPVVEIVDLTREREAWRGEPQVLSHKLQDELRTVVKRGEQAILFLNRRGFNTVIYCDDCGAARTCPRCDVSLTHHKPFGKLVCHYCEHVEPLEGQCRECKGWAMRPFGAGTQRIAEAVTAAVPEARVLRLDRDVTSTVGELDRTLTSFREGHADVMVGTQMVAKGHDFPRVTLVGIVLADASLAFPDFRAAERTFQLLTQVAGRAGRADAPGRVLIQTFQRRHYALACAVAHDTDRFFEIEAASRREARYPPYGRIGLVRFESHDPRALEDAGRLLRRAAEHACKDGELRYRGPASAPIARIRDRYRQMLMLFAPTPARLVQAMRRVRAEVEAIPTKVDVVFDVDPLDLL
jgi:primosomal protein N' (replication factor Y) (superfamily II helicase)